MEEIPELCGGVEPWFSYTCQCFLPSIKGNSRTALGSGDGRVSSSELSSCSLHSLYWNIKTHGSSPLVFLNVSFKTIGGKTFILIVSDLLGRIPSLQKHVLCRCTVFHTAFPHASKPYAVTAAIAVKAELGSSSMRCAFALTLVQQAVFRAAET